MSKRLLAALLVVQAHFAASYLVDLDAEAQKTFGGSPQVGLAPGDWRRRALGPNPGLRRLPALRDLPRRERGSGVFPRCPGGGGDLGFVWLVEGAGHGRGYPLATPRGGILRSHKGATHGPCLVVA